MNTDVLRVSLGDSGSAEHRRQTFIRGGVGSAVVYRGEGMDAAEVYLAKPAPEAIVEQLYRPINAVVGTLNPEGSIHLAYVIFLWDGEHFYFETASMTKKARNIAERPTASFAIDPPGFMVMAEGTGRIITGDQAHEINGRIRAKYLTPEARDGVGSAWGSIDDVAVEITPNKWRSWSSEPLTRMGIEAADGLPPHKWWVPEES